MKAAIYSGTFDPIHNGHISFAAAASERLGLDKIIFLPERQPWNKYFFAAYEHRYDMAELALKKEPDMEVQRAPLERFTLANSLPRLHEMTGNQARLPLLLGSDVFTRLATWKGLSDVSDQMVFIVGVRSDTELDQLRAYEASLATLLGAPLYVHYVSHDEDYVSSSRVRHGALQHVPYRVAEYIRGNNLYSDSLSASSAS